VKLVFFEHPLRSFIKNMELAPNSRFFSRVSGSRVFGARRVWQEVRGAKLEKLERSFSKHALIMPTEQT
jgi:hypothetical protein